MDSTRDDKIKQKEVIMKKPMNFLTTLLRLFFISVVVQVLFNLTPIQGGIFATFTVCFWIVVESKREFEEVKKKLEGDVDNEKKLDD